MGSEAVVDEVKEHLASHGRPGDFELFVRSSKSYGKDFSTVEEFGAVLSDLFGSEMAQTLCPRLAELMRAGEKRSTLAKYTIPPETEKRRSRKVPSSLFGPESPLDLPPLELPKEKATEQLPLALPPPSPPKKQQTPVKAAVVISQVVEEAVPQEEAVPPPAEEEAVPPAQEAAVVEAEVAVVDGGAPEEKEEEQEEDEEATTVVEEEPVVVPPAGSRHRCIATFASAEDWQLSVEESEIVGVLETHDDGWTDVVKVDGETGMVPTAYIVAEAAEEATAHEPISPQQALILDHIRGAIHARGSDVAITAAFVAAAGQFASGAMKADALHARLVGVFGDVAAASETCAALAKVLVGDDGKVADLKCVAMAAREPASPGLDLAALDSLNIHQDEREIVLARSHDVGKYLPEVMDRLQRLQADEELARRLQGEEDNVASSSTAADAVLASQLASAPEGYFDDRRATGESEIWSSIFGKPADDADAALARQLQAEEDARARHKPVVQKRPPYARAPAPGAAPPAPSPQRRAASPQSMFEAAPPASRTIKTAAATTTTKPTTTTASGLAEKNLSLFRCGACKETMHVRNAIAGSQFTCPLCGRTNTV